MTLCRKPPIMKLAVVADPETDVSFGVIRVGLATYRRFPLHPI